MNLQTFKNRIAKLGPHPGPQRKPTTVETRQELDRFLAEIQSRPAGAINRDSGGLREAEQECDRVQVVLANLYSQQATP